MKHVEERIVEALNAFGVPVEAGLLYASVESLPPRYFAFSVERAGTLFADDVPWLEHCRVSIHYFAPLAENVTTLVRRVKLALQAADFTWPSSMDASDSDGRHIVFECAALEEVEDNGEV